MATVDTNCNSDRETRKHNGASQIFFPTSHAFSVSILVFTVTETKQRERR